MEPSFPEPASGPFPAATHLGRIFTKPTPSVRPISSSSSRGSPRRSRT